MKELQQLVDQQVKRHYPNHPDGFLIDQNLGNVSETYGSNVMYFLKVIANEHFRNDQYNDYSVEKNQNITYLLAHKEGCKSVHII